MTRAAHISGTRVVSYTFADVAARDARRILRSAPAGTVTQSDVSGGEVYFVGPPGSAMRQIRDAIAALPGARRIPTRPATKETR